MVRSEPVELWNMLQEISVQSKTLTLSHLSFDAFEAASVPLFLSLLMTPSSFDQTLQSKQTIELLLEVSSPCHSHHWTLIFCHSQLLRSIVFPFFPLRSSQPTLYHYFTIFTNQIKITVKQLTINEIPSPLSLHNLRAVILAFYLFYDSSKTFPFQLFCRPPTLFLF